MPKQHIDMTVHRSVLLQEVLTHLVIHEGDTLVDATVGGAGHTRALAERVGPTGRVIGIDTDSDALVRARTTLGALSDRVTLIEGNFRDIAQILADAKVSEVHGVLFDLGYSSDQLESGRGFTFQKDEPLQMTLSTTRPSYTAADIVNTWKEDSLRDILEGWGEERYAARIARTIVKAREVRPFKTTQDLVSAIESAVPALYRRRKIHCATKTFQALRIAVNDEMGALAEGLEGARTRTQSGGHVAVITFHSIEDRIVKHLFRDWVRSGYGTLAIKKPLAPTRAEVLENPRARSAHLRVFTIA